MKLSFKDIAGGVQVGAQRSAKLVRGGIQRSATLGRRLAWRIHGKLPSTLPGADTNSLVLGSNGVPPEVVTSPGIEPAVEMSRA